jgi:hypothetical protein
MKKQWFTLWKVHRVLRRRRTFVVAGVLAAFIAIVGAGRSQRQADSPRISGAPPAVPTPNAAPRATTPAPAPAPTPAPVPTPAPASGFFSTRFYDNGSFWNLSIPANPPIDPNSVAIVAKSIMPFISSATFSNSDAWGIPYINASGVPAKTYTIACTKYCTGDTITFPIPAGAQPSTGSDHHLSVINGRLELDMWLASYDPDTDSWSAGVRVINDLAGWGAFCGVGQHCNSAEASGFSLLGGNVRPDEIALGHIDHALALITPYTRSEFIACPATHTDGRVDDPAAIPEGAHIQLDPSFNVDAQPWDPWEKMIAKALQTYGAYVVDTGGALAIRGVTDQNIGTKWSSVGTPKARDISNLPWDQIRVLQIQPCG